ncbi:MAG: hypothetical protein NVS3B17_07180 [Vulcanimicrobiaceae bacterium]
MTGPLEREMTLGIDAENLARDRRGMGRLARGVLRAIAESGHFEVVLLADDRRLRRSLAEEFPYAIAATKSAARRDRYDVVWFPFNGMRYRAHAPTLVSLHDAFAFTHAHRDPIARGREQRPIRRAAKHATRVLAISTWARDEIVRTLDVSVERIAVVAPSPDPFWFPAGGDVLPAALAGTRYVLFVGPSEDRKNVRLAIEACARAFRREDEALVIAGTLAPADRAFARARHVRAGEIDASDAMLRALYRNAELVLVPSLAEGFGLVAVEAMACGAAVIASDATALPEATGGAAVLIDPHDAATWAGAVRTLLDDPQRLAALRERATTRFAFADRTAFGRATLGLLRELGAR